MKIKIGMCAPIHKNLKVYALLSIKLINCLKNKYKNLFKFAKCNVYYWKKFISKKKTFLKNTHYSSFAI